jgi:glycosyltransferase involved in cell wall biosynthesis
MIVLTTTYNCEKYVEKSLLSIMSQRFKDFKCYITDDISTDNTVKIIQETIKNDDRFILIQNKEKLYQGGNYDQIIRGLNIDDEEICVEVDGDDWLPTSNVFSKINEVYSDGKTWITSGSFKYSDGRKGFANPPSNFENIRNSTFTLSHLRTWKAWLWKKIQIDDLKNENGIYWTEANDVAFMFPMVEMSGEEHFTFINEILYIYNETNPLNEHKVNINNLNETARKIRSKPPYKKLI